MNASPSIPLKKRIICRTPRKEIVRFLIVGTIVIATDFSIYYFLFHFLSFSLSKAISFTCAGIVGYLFNKYWTFKNDQPSFAEIGRYILINLLALGVNVLTNQSVLNKWPQTVYLALVITTIVTSLFTFICFKYWVFRVIYTAARKTPMELE